MSRFATMTTRERKLQAAVICREIQSGEGKQEGHVPGQEAEKFHLKYKNPRFYQPKYRINVILVLPKELFKAGTTVWFKLGGSEDSQQLRDILASLTRVRATASTRR